MSKKRLALIGASIALVALVITGCATPASAPLQATPSATVATPSATPTRTATPTPTRAPVTTPPRTDKTAFDLTTDAGICAADAEMTNLELNDALAPILGYATSKKQRTTEQTEEIRAYKNAAFQRACPARAS